MIVVTGSKRAGTSAWMQVLTAAGLPWIGERFPLDSARTLRAANPEGFFESELVAGIYHATNPHPVSGAYLAPEATRRHVVKVFTPGLVRSDVAFLDHVVATVRDWRASVISTRRLQRLLASRTGDALAPPLQWWCDQYGLLRDLAIRGYAIHVVGFGALRRDPERVVTETLRWLGVEGPLDAAVAAVKPALAGTQVDAPDGELLGAACRGLAPEIVATFDALYDAIDRGRALDASFVAHLNETDAMLRPLIREQQAAAEAAALADMLARR